MEIVGLHADLPGQEVIDKPHSLVQVPGRLHASHHLHAVSNAALLAENGYPLLARRGICKQHRAMMVYQTSSAGPPSSK
jgi:hypothetical protein